jgi:hypothetical protein
MKKQEKEKEGKKRKIVKKKTMRCMEREENGVHNFNRDMKEKRLL